MSPARKTGLSSNMCLSSVCDAYLSAVTTAVVMLSASTCYWKSNTATWDHETPKFLGFFWLGSFMSFLKRVTYLHGDLNRRSCNDLAEQLKWLLKKGYISMSLSGITGHFTWTLDRAHSTEMQRLKLWNGVLHGQFSSPSSLASSLC